MPASVDKAADKDSEEDDEAENHENAGGDHPGGPRWTKFEDGAAIMLVDVESKEPNYTYTCKYISLHTTPYTRYLHTWLIFTRFLHAI